MLWRGHSGFRGAIANKTCQSSVCPWPLHYVRQSKWPWLQPCTKTGAPNRTQVNEANASDVRTMLRACKARGSYFGIQRVQGSGWSYERPCAPLLSHLCALRPDKEYFSNRSASPNRLSAPTEWFGSAGALRPRVL